MKLRKAVVNNIILYITVGLALLITVKPLDGLLAYGVYMGAMYCAHPIVASLMYIASSAVNGLDGIIQAGVRVGVMALIITVHRLWRRRIGKRLLLLYVVLCNIFYCLYGSADGIDTLNKCVNVVLGGAFAIVCIYVLRMLFTRGLSYRPAVDEWICLALFCSVMFYCMYGIHISIYSIGQFVAPLFMLFALSCGGTTFAFAAAVAGGMGALASTAQFVTLGMLTIMAAVASMFYKINRYVAALSVCACDVILAYFANTYGTFDAFMLIPAAISVVAFMAIPPRFTNYLADLIGVRTGNAGKAVVNKLRYNLSRKLYGLSDVFFAMKNTFVAMTVNATPPDKVPPIIVDQLRDNVCAQCPRRAECWRNNGNSTQQAMLQLTQCAVQRGKATIMDISPQLTVSCDRLNNVLSFINTSADSYNSYYAKSSETDNSRLLIADQLGGVSRIMQKLASECKGRVTFDSTKEKETIEQLTFHNILATEAVFVEQNNVLSVIVTVAKKDLDGEAIAKITGNVLKKNLYVEKVEPTDSDTWVAVYLAVRPSLQMSYGIRSVTKAGSNMSGDTHSFISIEGGRFLLAVCDGMGSGENAERMSDTAIGLVENFYKAGFDNDVVLSGVNRLLTGYNTETFTAVDICVADLNNGLCDFIKLGAASGLVKIGGEVQEINGSSLPLGVLEEMRPSITKKALNAGDFIVLMSDGMHDCFGEENTLAEMLADTVMTNPQIIADEMMEKALATCKNKPQDDMTIIVARLVQ